MQLPLVFIYLFHSFDNWYQKHMLLNYRITEPVELVASTEKIFNGKLHFLCRDICFLWHFLLYQIKFLHFIIFFLQDHKGRWRIKSPPNNTQYYFGINLFLKK